MNNNENIIELSQNIEEMVNENGACAQLFGSWTKKFTEEERAQLFVQLREKGIENIKLYDYAELYVMSDIDSTKREQIIAEYKEITTRAFEKAAAENYLRTCEIEELEQFIDIIGNERPDFIVKILMGDYNRYDDDDDE